MVYTTYHWSMKTAFLFLFISFSSEENLLLWDLKTVAYFVTSSRVFYLFVCICQMFYQTMRFRPKFFFYLAGYYHYSPYLYVYVQPPKHQIHETYLTNDMKIPEFFRWD